MTVPSRLRAPCILLLAVLLALLIPRSAVLAKLELLQNGTFASDVASWTPTSTSGAILWAGSEGHTAPGAAQVENNGTRTTTYSEGAFQCVLLNTPVAGDYEAQGWIRIPTQTNTSAAGYIRVHFYSNPDCSGSVGTSRDTNQVPVGSGWTFVSLNGTSTPAGAQSAKVRLLVQKAGGTGPAYAYFDDVSFFPSTPNAVARINPEGLLRPSPLLSLLTFRLPLALLPEHGVRSFGLFAPRLSEPRGGEGLATGTLVSTVASPLPLFPTSPAGRAVGSTPWRPREISPPGRRSTFPDPIVPDAPPHPAVKFVVRRDGLYTVSGAELARVPGWDPKAAVTSLRLLRRGQEIPLEIIGGEGGHLDPQDRLLFYGQARHGSLMDEKYSDEEVYWLTWGQGPGRRILPADGSPQPAAPRLSVLPFSARLEVDRTWYTHHALDFPTRNTWWWGRIRTRGTAAAETFRGHLLDAAPNTSARLSYEVASRRPRGRHHIQVFFNGRLVDDHTFVDQAWQVFTTTLPAGSLIPDVALTVRTFPDAGKDEDLYVNGYTLTYTRTLDLSAGPLLLTLSPSHAVTLVVHGVKEGEGPVQVWDVSAEGTVRLLTGMEVEAGGKAIAIGVRAGWQRLLIVNAGQWLHPRLQSYRPSPWRRKDQGADLIILSPAGLMPAAERLAMYRRQQGYRVAVVDVDGLYNDFAWGWYHPEAIRAFLAYAHTHWQPPAPRYVMLMGNGHWNFKGLNPTTYGPLPPNFIPPYLAWVDPWQGEVPMDQAYVTFEGNDDLPDMAIGRIPVRSLAEAEAVVDKIIAYEAGTPVLKARVPLLLVADNADKAGNFSTLLDNVAKEAPLWARGERVVLEDSERVLPAKERLRQILEEGTFLVLYSGHGGVDRWASERLLSSADVSGLDNKQWPLVATFSCLDGYFAYPSTATRWQSLAATMLRRPQGGSIAAWSPAGLGNLQGEDPLARAFVQELASKGGQAILGDLILQAKEHVYQTHGATPTFFTQTLLGDPLLHLRLPRVTFLPSLVR